MKNKLLSQAQRNLIEREQQSPAKADGRRDGEESEATAGEAVNSPARRRSARLSTDSLFSDEDYSTPLATRMYTK